MNSDVSNVAKGSKTVGIVVSILMVLLGIGVFMAPQFFVSMMVWLFVFGLMIYGVYLVYEYAVSEVKNGWSLTTGIIAIILGFMLIFSPALVDATTFAFILAFMVLFTGINQVSASAAIKRAGGSDTMWLTASGVINIILGFFFLFNPYVFLLIFPVIAGIYLIVGGIALFASSMTSNA
ncbi:HdeD family acid-resistance protein [Acetobacterium sp.]|uniref:HdeD family acid-resistance protein n=1 Tax=Acetobacterium sp. TaxID=1872094 RepID=UPI002F3E4929